MNFSRYYREAFDPNIMKMDKNKKAEIIRTDLTKEIYLCYIQLQL